MLLFYFHNNISIVNVTIKVNMYGYIKSSINGPIAVKTLCIILKRYNFQTNNYNASDMASNPNAFAFKCILNAFQKFLHLHLEFSNDMYLHLHFKIQIFFKYFQIHFANTINYASQIICCFFFLFCKTYDVSYSFYYY